MVRYREIRPCAQLRPFINTFWILEHDAGMPRRSGSFPMVIAS
jgi:hypothetical protein